MKERKMKKNHGVKGRILMLISALIGTAYLVYLISYFTGGVSNATEDAEAIGSALATVLVTPHMIFVGIAALMSWLALFCKISGFALAAGIVYLVAIIVFPMYFMFVIIEAILSFIGYARMRKSKKAIAASDN